jgi:hypothetical protein
VGGTYLFTTNSDDGSRVFLDGVPVINDWVNHGPTTHTATQTIAAGTHEVKVEYFEDGGGSQMFFSYVKTGSTNPPPSPTPTPTPSPVPPPPPVPTPTPPPTGFYLGQYWNVPGATNSPTIPNTTPNFTRNDSAIAFNWDRFAPDPVISNDHFVARWTKADTFVAGNYQFNTNSDDGIRVYLDGVAVIDKWIDQGPTDYTATIPVTAGNHEVKVEYFEDGGGAQVYFSYAPASATPPPPPVPTPTPPLGPQFIGHYWNVPGTASAPLFPITAPDYTQNDSQINFNWLQGSPSALINNNHFIVRWTKAETFVAGTYRFRVTSDDGVRVYVDNRLILERWIDQGPTSYIITTNITGGDHTVKVEYYDDTGGAEIQFSYVKLQ